MWSMEEYVERIYDDVVELADTYERAYYVMLDLLRKSKLLCLKYDDGCNCWKCRLREAIESELIKHYFLVPTQMMFVDVAS